MYTITPREEQLCPVCGERKGKIPYNLPDQTCSNFRKEQWFTNMWWENIALCEECFSDVRYNFSIQDAWQLPYIVAAKAFHCLGVVINKEHAIGEIAHLYNIY